MKKKMFISKMSKIAISRRLAALHPDHEGHRWTLVRNTNYGHCSCGERLSLPALQSQDVTGAGTTLLEVDKLKALGKRRRQCYEQKHIAYAQASEDLEALLKSICKEGEVAFIDDRICAGGKLNKSLVYDATSLLKLWDDLPELFQRTALETAACIDKTSAETQKLDGLLLEVRTTRALIEAYAFPEDRTAFAQRLIGDSELRDALKGGRSTTHSPAHRDQTVSLSG